MNYSTVSQMCLDTFFVAMAVNSVPRHAENVSDFALRLDPETATEVIRNYVLQRLENREGLNFENVDWDAYRNSLILAHYALR